MLYVLVQEFVGANSSSSSSMQSIKINMLMCASPKKKMLINVLCRTSHVNELATLLGYRINIFSCVSLERGGQVEVINMLRGQSRFPFGTEGACLQKSPAFEVVICKMSSLISEAYISRLLKMFNIQGVEQ